MTSRPEGVGGQGFATIVLKLNFVIKSVTMGVGGTKIVLNCLTSNVDDQMHSRV